MVAVITATGANTFFWADSKISRRRRKRFPFQRAVMKIATSLYSGARFGVDSGASRVFDMRGHYDRAILLRLAESFSSFW